MAVKPTQDETDWILKKARHLIDHATGAHYCECVNHEGPASGFRTKRDPDCPKCDRYSGLIKNRPWDGDPETVEPLIAHVKAGQGGGTVSLEDSSWYQVTAKGLSLTVGRWTDAEREVSMTWSQIIKALVAEEPAQMTLAI